MAAYRVGKRMTYVVGPKSFAGGVGIGRVSTGTRDKRTADLMERALEELALTGWGDLVARLGVSLRLPDLYAAKLEGPAALQRLRDHKNDPALADLLAKASYVTDARAKDGLRQLRALLIPLEARGARLSWLTDPRNLNRLYAEAAKSGREPNSIRRSLHRAVSEVLSHELGRGKMLAIMADVRKPHAKDERDVDLTPNQIQRLLDACDLETRPVVELALLTGIDLMPLLRLRPMDFDEATGTVRVDDRKATSRQRSVELPHAAAAIVRKLSRGVPEGRPILGLTKDALRHRFDDARKRAELPGLRFKDLRAVFATNYLRAGGSPKNLMAILGHSSMTMTLRYLRRLPTRQGQDMEAAAEKMGLTLKQTLKVEKGGA